MDKSSTFATNNNSNNKSMKKRDYDRVCDVMNVAETVCLGLASAAAGVLAVANVARGGGLAATLVLGGAAAMLGLLTASEVKEMRRTGR